MIRKTSLLRKIEPMMRRSSFTKKNHHPEALQARRSNVRSGDNVSGIRNCLQIRYSERSPLYDVINPA
nr:hypothetical protein [Aulosira sp. DedVER01a]